MCWSFIWLSFHFQLHDWNISINLKYSGFYITCVGGCISQALIHAYPLSVFVFVHVSYKVKLYIIIILTQTSNIQAFYGRVVVGVPVCPHAHFFSCPEVRATVNYSFVYKMGQLLIIRDVKRVRSKSRRQQTSRRSPALRFALLPTTLSRIRWDSCISRNNHKLTLSRGLCHRWRLVLRCVRGVWVPCCDKDDLWPLEDLRVRRCTQLSAS